MFVKSLKTGEKHKKPTCKCISWIEHWEINRYSVREPARWCRACRKLVSKDKIFGGHVIKVGSNDKDYYIVPLCVSCNNKDPFEFKINNLEDLIPAKAESCVNNHQ